MAFSTVERSHRGIRARRGGGPRRIVASAVVLALGAYTYHPALATDAILAALVVAVRWRDSRRRRNALALSIGAGCAAVLLIPYGIAFFTAPIFTARAHELWVFESGVDRTTLGRLAGGYVAQWDPRQLVRDIGPNLRSTPGRAPLFAFTLPFFAIGLITLLRRRSPGDVFLLLWLALAPLTGALMLEPGPITVEWSRSLAFLAAATLTIALGLDAALGAMRGWRPALAVAAAGVVLFVASAELGSFVSEYFTDYARRAANAWQDGSGPALVAARGDIPSGGVLCVDSRRYFQYTLAQQAALYLEPRDFTLLEGGWDGSDTRCFEPGAHILTFPDELPAVPTSTVRTTYDVAGVPRFVEVVIAAK